MTENVTFIICILIIALFMKFCTTYTKGTAPSSLNIVVRRRLRAPCSKKQKSNVALEESMIMIITARSFFCHGQYKENKDSGLVS